MEMRVKKITYGIGFKNEYKLLVGNYSDNNETIKNFTIFYKYTGKIEKADEDYPKLLTKEGEVTVDSKDFVVALYLCGEGEKFGMVEYIKKRHTKDRIVEGESSIHKNKSNVRQTNL